MNFIKNTAIVAVAATLFSCTGQVKEVKTLKTELDSVSYAVGLSMSSQLKRGFTEVDRSVLIQGIQNGLDSTGLLIQEKDIKNILKTYFNNKKNRESEAKFAENKAIGIAFLETNKNKKDVVTTASGLQYVVLKKGTGEKPAGPTTKVKVHYHGTNIAGEVFDSSVDRKKPSEFGLNQVIKGWTEGLQLMNVGSKYQFFVPQELAYGPQQRGKKIAPFSTLIFEVELLEILK